MFTEGTRRVAAVPPKMRVEYAGAHYHLMTRGDRRDDISLDDVDRQRFQNEPNIV